MAAAEPVAAAEVAVVAAGSLLEPLINYSWLVFWIYWFSWAIIKNPPSASERRNSSGRPGRFLLLVIIIAIFISTANSELLSRQIAPHQPLIKALGVILFYTGLALALWARHTLGDSWAMAGKVQKRPKLVTRGPYKLIRHPIYSGVILAFLGSAIALNYGWLAIFMVSFVVFGLSALREEETLSRQLPKDYPAYKRRTKMLIPYIF